MAKSIAKARRKTVSQNKKVRIPKRDRSATEEKLIKAGTFIFSKYGYDGATTKLISTKSGVNESLIMRYFGGKEGLLLDILKRYFEKSRATPLPYPPQNTLSDELIQYIRYGQENAKKENEVLRIMLLRASLDANVRKKVLAILPLEGDLKLIERINLLKSKGKLHPNVNPDLVAMIGFQNFCTVFISGFLFDEKLQREIQENLEKVTMMSVIGLLEKQELDYAKISV